MKSWFVQGVLWGLVGVATFAFTLLTTTATGPAVPVPTWVPFAALGLLFVGWSVLRRGLMDASES